MKQVRCEHCEHWTDGTATHCSYCGGRLGAKYHDEKEKLRQLEPSGIPFIKVDPNGAWHKRSVQHLVRFGQLIFFGIISMIAAMASSTVH